MLSLLALLRSYLGRVIHDTRCLEKWLLMKLKVIEIIYLDLSSHYRNRGYFRRNVKNSQV